MHELIETATHNCQATKVFTATRFATDLSARAERQLPSGRERSLQRQAKDEADRDSMALAPKMWTPSQSR